MNQPPQELHLDERGGAHAATRGERTHEQPCQLASERLFEAKEGRRAGVGLPGEGRTVLEQQF